MQQVTDVKPSSTLPVSETTFADLLRPLIDPGFRLALAMLHDAQAAEDAVQEASFIAWRKLGRMHDQGRVEAVVPGHRRQQMSQRAPQQVVCGRNAWRARRAAGPIARGADPSGRRPA